MLNQFMRYLPLARLIKNEHSEIVLEVGGGVKGLNVYLPGQAIVGVDINFKEPAAAAGRFTPIKGSALRLPFECGSFPVVVCSDVLEHIAGEDRETAIKELWRVAGRKIFLSFPVRETHGRWERLLLKTYKLLKAPSPDWLADHMAKGLPYEADISGFLKRSRMPFTVVPNENNLIHFLVMLTEMTFLCGYLNYISDILAPETWDKGAHSRKANLARVLLWPLRNLPESLNFGSVVRKIFIIAKEEPLRLPAGPERLRNGAEATNMSNIRITVIVPTYNRKETLGKCLAALSGQTYPASGYEVIVVDDGSTDGTGEAVTEWTSGGGVRYFRQEHKGPAAARNLGVRSAAGKILLFTGDDMLADPGLLARHAAWHEDNPAESAALLGYVTWAREGEITPFMRWLESGGPQFSYGELEGKTEADPRRFFYTSNISLKKNFLAANGLFDEDFPYAAYEDAELGLRLAAKGLTLGYDRQAVANHDHYTSLGTACRRMVKVGESSVLLAKKAGDRTKWGEKTALRRLLSPLKFAVYYPLAKWYERRSVNGEVFRYVMDSCFFKGVEQGEKRWK